MQTFRAPVTRKNALSVVLQQIALAKMAAVEVMRGGISAVQRNAQSAGQQLGRWADQGPFLAILC